MCRLYGFRSAVYSGVHRSLVAAENALARQSEQHADGWGLAYYVHGFPHLIRSHRQALADDLFKDVSGLVETRTLLAHIRRSTIGRINVLNCHPFQHGAWTFAHNGQLAGFAADAAVRARVRDAVDPRFRRYVMGETDSELMFHLFLSQLARRVDSIHDPGVSIHHTVDALRETVRALLALAPDAPDRPRDNRLTVIVTNGRVMVGYRFRQELYYSTYKTLCPERDLCPVYEPQRCEAPVRDGIVKHLILGSERISETPNVWLPLEHDAYVSVTQNMNLHQGKLLKDAPPERLPWIDEAAQPCAAGEVARPAPPPGDGAASA